MNSMKRVYVDKSGFVFRWNKKKVTIDHLDMEGGYVIPVKVLLRWSDEARMAQEVEKCSQ